MEIEKMTDPDNMGWGMPEEAPLDNSTNAVAAPPTSVDSAETLFTQPSDHDPWAESGTVDVDQLPGINEKEEEVVMEEAKEEEQEEPAMITRDKIVAKFVDGPIGIQFNHEGEIVMIKKGTQAENIPGLSKDDLLVSLAGRSTSGLSLKQIMQILMSEKRPIEFEFERHKNWSRNKNGLPSIDEEMLNILFHTFDDTDTGSLDVNGFTKFMKEVHEMAVAYTGREKDELEGAYDHAQDLIDAHDEDDDGRLSFEELQLWLGKSLAMGDEERKAYSKRGGYCPDSIRFVEDIAHGLHVAIDAEKEQGGFEAGLPEVKSSNGDEKKEEVEVEVEEVEVEEEVVEEVVEEEEEEEEEEEVEVEEEEEEGEEEFKSNKIDDSDSGNSLLPTQKNQLRAIKLLPGLPNVQGIIKAHEHGHHHVQRWTERGCVALSSGMFMQHMGMSTMVATFAIESLLDAEDMCMRAAIVEACLNNADMEDLDEDDLLDSVYVHLNRERVMNLLEKLKLENTDLAYELKVEAEACHSEKARFQNLVRIVEAVAVPTESEWMEMKGIPRAVDEKHRYALAATIDRLSLTFTAERVAAIQKAIQETVEWKQMAEVLEGVIVDRESNELMASAIGDGLCCCNRPKMEMLREHVRCSIMMPHSPKIYESVENKLEKAETSYDLVDVLMLIINKFVETVIRLSEGRATEKVSTTLLGYTTITPEENKSVKKEVTNLKQSQQEHDQLRSLMEGTMTAEEFASVGRTDTKYGTTRSRTTNSKIKSRTKSGSETTRATLKPLNSATRASVGTMFQALKNIQSNPMEIQEDLLSHATSALEKTCVTVAGAAKLLLILFHPRLTNIDKDQQLECAALASNVTDVDDLLNGERRLLRSVVSMYMGGKRNGSPEAEAAHRAVENSTSKQDVIEILHVMVLTKARLDIPLPPVRGASATEEGEKRRRAAKRAAARGNDFFNGGGDEKDDVLVEGRSEKNKELEEEGSQEEVVNKKTRRSELIVVESPPLLMGEDEDFNVMVDLKKMMVPSPPPRPPAAKNGEEKSRMRGGSRGPRVRGPKGLRYVKSLNKTRVAGPPSSLFSYQGVKTMWTGEKEK